MSQSRRRKGPVNGWVILDKPLGLGSTPALGKVRWVLGAAKGGHGGTLDPLATGILPLAFGEATKALPHIVDATKTYRFTLRFGIETTTLDGEGTAVAQSPARPDDTAITAALAGFVGDIAQVPPAFSALKVAGARAYDLARAGQAVDLAARTVTIEALRLVERPDADHAVFEVICGKGTYVRALGRDLALTLGTVGHLAALRRTRVGPFTEEQAVALDRVTKMVELADVLRHSPPPDGVLLPVETALDDIPARAVTEAEALALKQGRALHALPGTGDWHDGSAVRLMAPQGLVALGRYDGPLIRPVRVFNLF